MRKIYAKELREIVTQAFDAGQREMAHSPDKKSRALYRKGMIRDLVQGRTIEKQLAERDETLPANT